MVRGQAVLTVHTVRGEMVLTLHIVRGQAVLSVASSTGGALGAERQSTPKQWDGCWRLERWGME